MEIEGIALQSASGIRGITPGYTLTMLAPAAACSVWTSASVREGVLHRWCGRSIEAGRTRLSMRGSTAVVELVCVTLSQRVVPARNCRGFPMIRGASASCRRWKQRLEEEDRRTTATQQSGARQSRRLSFLGSPAALSRTGNQDKRRISC